MMVIGSAVHALWVPRGLAIKYSDAVGGYAPELIAALGGYWCNLGRRFYESFYRNLFPGVGRFHVESAGDLTMRLS